jgi:hypothetical protein
MNICPSYKNLSAAEDDNSNKSNICYPLIDDEKIIHLEEIRALTPYPVSVWLLACQNVKSQEKNYCKDLCSFTVEKKACESNQTKYVYIYLKKWTDEHSESKLKKETEYLVAFARFPKKDEGTHKEIVAEVMKTAKWLGVSGNNIHCSVFYHYKPDHLCPTFDLGTIKKKYYEACRKPNYTFLLRSVSPNPKGNPRLLSVNVGSPLFSIEVKDA